MYNLFDDLIDRCGQPFLLAPLTNKFWIPLLAGALIMEAHSGGSISRALIG